MANLFQVNARAVMRRAEAGCASIRRGFLALRWLVLCHCLLITAGAAGAEKTPQPAELQVSGYGFLGNRDLKRMLRTLELAGRKPEYFSPSFVEDAALILSSRIRRDGYLRSRVRLRLRLELGAWVETSAEELLENPLPRPMRVREVRFLIEKGPLFHFRELRFEGLETVSEDRAVSFFMDPGPLLHLKRYRIFTPERLRRGLASLSETLERQGYQTARVGAGQVVQDERTGAVDVRIRVEQGARSIVRSVLQEFHYDEGSSPDEIQTVQPNRPYSKFWVQDFVQSLKTNLYHRGFPDVTAQLETVTETPSDDRSRIYLDLRAAVNSGPRVRIGTVHFEGHKKTRPRLLSRRVRVERGEFLDPVRVENGRFRLAQLGIFDTVDVDYKPVDGNTRDLVYRLKEGRTRDLNLLFGWGSYELLRGGFIADQYNIWGLAHHARLKAVQSFKASSGEFTYTMPDLVGHDLDTFLHASGLRREEPTFTRLEYGGGLGAHTFYRPLSTDLDLRYSYQILDAASLVPAVAGEGPVKPAVGSVIADVKFDRRDNPLYPRKGYRWFLTVDNATEFLGGDVNYQRIETSASWHLPLGGGRWIHLGLSHGAAISFGSAAENLPFNRRFFPGGANSIRGFQEAEASPKNQEGEIVGAETYTLASVEVEQSLTPKWFLVVFLDSLGFARRIEDYPFDTGLYSVGAGLRWRTIVGPVRLEYGHNLNPRPRDPSGTFQFSLGFPF